MRGNKFGEPLFSDNTCSVHCDVPGRTAEGYLLFLNSQFLMARPSRLRFSFAFLLILK